MEEQIKDILIRLEVLEKMLIKKSNKVFVLSEQHKEERIMLLRDLPSLHKTNDNFSLPIIQNDYGYFVFLTHILTHIELRSGKEIPIKWNILDTNPRPNNSYWYTKSKLLTEMSVQKFSNITELAVLNNLGINKKNINKKHIFLVKLVNDKTYPIQLVCQQPLVKIKDDKVVTISEYVKLVEDKIFGSSIPMCDEEYTTSTLYIPKGEIVWNKMLADNEGRQLWKSMTFSEGYIPILKSRINSVKEFINALEVLAKNKQLDFSNILSKKNSYAFWIEKSTLLSTQIDYFWSEVLRLAELEDFQSQFTFERFIGKCSRNINTLTCHKSNLQVVLGFYVGVYYTYGETKVEPDLYSIFLSPNFPLFLELCLSYCCCERNNKNSTNVKRVMSCLTIYSGFFVHRFYSHFPYIRETIDYLTKLRNKIFRDIKAEKRKVQGYPAVTSEKAPSMKELQEVANTLRYKLIYQESLTEDEIKQILFFSFASRCYAFRPFHYLGMQWGTNIATLDSFTHYKTKEKDVEKDSLLWAKKFVTDYLKNNKDDKWCVAFNQLNGHIRHKRSAQTSVFLQFYHSMSLIISDVACRILLSRGNVTHRERKQLEDYLDNRRKNFHDNSLSNIVDIMCKYYSGEHLFGEPIAKNNRKLTSLYRKALSGDTSMYTLRQLRHMTMEYLSSVGLSEKARNLLCKTWFLHSLQTNLTVYDQSNSFMSSTAMKHALDIGFTNREIINKANQEAEGVLLVSGNLEIDSSIQKIIQQNCQVWDVHNEVLLLFEISLCEDETDVETAEVDCRVIESYPSDVEYDCDFDTWLLIDVLKVILCQLRLDSEFEKVTNYLKSIKHILTEVDLDEYEKLPEWKERVNLIELMQKTKRRKLT